MEGLDRNDYIEIVELIKKRLREHGLSDLAEDSSYLKETEDDRLVLPDPKLHSVMLLQAFKRHMAANSQETLTKALSKIKDYSKGTFPEIVRIERISRIDSEDSFLSEFERSIDLRDAPQRSELISSAARLIDDLQDFQAE